MGHWLDKNSNRREDVIVPFFIQMLQGVAYIHEKGVIHRDLKPSNILFAIEGDGKWIKIGDFGLATAHQNRSLLPDLKALQLESSNPQHAKSPTHTMEVGTSLYMSPEQEDNGKYDHKVDIWALGLILIELYFILDNLAAKKRTNQKQSEIKITILQMYFQKASGNSRR